MDVVVAVIVGLFVGGIINALSDILPYHPFQKPLHYADGTRRPVSAWLGTTAFLLGQRKSATATPETKPLPWRYPLTEWATMVLFGMTIIASHQNNFDGIQAIIYLLFIAILVLVFVIDVEHKLILFVVMIPSIIFAIAKSILLPPPDLSEALRGSAIGFGVFFLLYLGGFVFTFIMGQIRGREINTVAFGFGDVMLITFSGAILGVAYTITAMFLAVFLGAFGAIAYLLLRLVLKGRYQMFTAIPYGPYIIIATTLLLLYGPQIWYAIWGYYPA